MTTGTTDRYRQGPTDPLAAAPRPIDQWPRDEQGRVTMGGGALDLDDLLNEPAL